MANPSVPPSAPVTTRWRSWPRLAVLVVFAALAIAAAAASAATRITKTNRVGNQAFEATGDPQLIALGEGYGTSLPVTTAGPARLAILFNAECSVAAPDHGTWLAVEILVDGVPVSPTDIFHALCTSDGDSLLNSWFSAASDASVDVAAGTHTIELRGTLFGTPVIGFDWWIGDLSLIVIANDL